ncbi:Lysosomal amino acid transporter 1 [Vanrija pseudolonga]|uniref:Lysosomal amino acid transporter 1 n=1 Tax=Vanrija pseudolonga TaxID=143232 RepID=A0AAF1BPR3_9TREE|nr:Lysosomal amino acid transporter 1 [Vanrija pseudolonga]
MGGDEALAEWFGLLSIGFWLCAQLPQVIKNYQLKSCDGLSLPFLVNWLFGDLTNFIGCVLTDQLPFQTYLAAYFCVVDVTLVGQFFHYRPKVAAATPRQSSLSHPSPRTSLILPPPAQRDRSHVRSTTLPGGGPPSPTPLYGHVHGHAHANSLPLTRPTSGRGTRRGRPPLSRDPSQGDFSRLPTTDSAEALYAAALDVARAAERVHARRSTSNRPRPRHAATVPAPRSDSQAALNSTQSEVSLHSSSTDDEDEDAAHARLTQSVGALAEPRGRTLTRNSTGLATPQNELEQSDTLDDLRDSHVLEIRRRVGSRSQNRSGSQARARGSGRRAATVAFMGLGLLFWRGAVPGVVVPRGGGGEGHVVERIEQVSAASSVSAWHTAPLHPPVLGYRPRTFVTFEDPEDPRDPPPPPPPKDEEPDLKEVIGRISAWCCTTLYLTSRLPQIWKNFQRKSVEGLSILLFIFAFLGNVAYVASIVFRPAPPGEGAHYLLKALPYLLGSGGTLLFDLTIMIQSVIYGSAPPVPESPLDHPRPRRTYSSRRRPRHADTWSAGQHASFHAEDGLATSERRPLLSAGASPIRTTSDAWGARKDSGTSAHSSGGSAGNSGLVMTSGGGSASGLGVRLYGSTGDASAPSAGASPGGQ